MVWSKFAAFSSPRTPFPANFLLADNSRVEPLRYTAALQRTYAVRSCLVPWSAGLSSARGALQLLQPVEHDRDSAEAGSSSEIKYLRVP